jgi:hypothetical protein
MGAIQAGFLKQLFAQPARLRTPVSQKALFEDDIAKPARTIGYRFEYNVVRGGAHFYRDLVEKGAYSRFATFLLALVRGNLVHTMDRPSGD